MLLLPNRFDGLRGRYRSARFARTCSTAIYDLQSAYQTAFAYLTALADFLCFIIRKLRLALVVCFGFIRDEYLIALVDFIVALRRTKGRGRRTLRSPPSPSSGLHLIHPGNPLRRGTLAAAVYTNLGSCIQVLSLIPSSEYSLVVCVRAEIVRVSVGVLGVYRTFFIIGGIDRLCLRLREVFAMFFRRICADRDWIVSFGW